MKTKKAGYAHETGAGACLFLMDESWERFAKRADIVQTELFLDKEKPCDFLGRLVLGERRSLVF